MQCGFALASLLMLTGSANAQQEWCPGNRVVHVLVGRDEYWIPTRYDPHFEVDEGEQRARTEVQKSGSRHNLIIHCQQPNERAWRVRWIGVQIPNVTTVPVPRPATAEGIQALMAVSLQKRRPDFRLQNYPWAESQSPYLASRDGRHFLSKENIFLESKVEIETIPGFAARISSPIGKDTIANATAALPTGKKMPSDETIASMARLIGEWKINSK
jgi:hypothetical protein